MSEEIPQKGEKEPKTKGKTKPKSTVVKFDEPAKVDEVPDLDNLDPSDEVAQIYKVYWSRKHDQIVAKIQIRRADKKGSNLGRNRQFADTLTKIPIGQLKDKRSALFIDFMSELIKDEIRR